ncbi:MAG: hypothetical protein ABEI06_00215 [Halobacteriaceae archaeon]
MRIRDFLHISAKRQRQVTRLLQLALIGFLFIGLDRKNLGIVVNTVVAIVVTEIPAFIERDYNVSMDPALVLWITVAVFLHALGTLGPYQNVWWWDHVTHLLSSSIVAGAGYAFARALDSHSAAIELPPKFTFVYLLIVVLAFGVFWEVIEFGVSGLASWFQMKSIATQYGLDDTMMDLIFDTIGGIIVATWGTVYLSQMLDSIIDHIGKQIQSGK